MCQKYYCQQTTLDDKQIIWEANSLPKSFAKKGEKKMLPIGDQKRSSLRVSEVRGHQQLVHQVSYYSLILRISKLSWGWSCVYSVFVFPLELSIFLISAVPFKWGSICICICISITSFDLPHNYKQLHLNGRAAVNEPSRRSFDPLLTEKLSHTGNLHL